MSIEEVDRAIHELSERDNLVQTPGMCRYAAKKMMEVASKADKTAPKTKKEIVVWPDASITLEGVHYALRVSGPGKDVRIYNPSRAASFPRFMGPLASTTGNIFKKMIVVKEIL